MKIIFQQTAQFSRVDVGPGGAYHVWYFGEFKAYYAPKERVLLCDGKFRTFNDDDAFTPEPTPEPQRKLVDIAKRTSGDYQAQAVRDAVEYCDWFFDFAANWCAEHSVYPADDPAAAAQP